MNFARAVHCKYLKFIKVTAPLVVFPLISKVDFGNGGEIPTDVELILCRDWPDNRGSTVFYLPRWNSSHLSHGNPKIH